MYICNGSYARRMAEGITTAKHELLLVSTFGFVLSNAANIFNLVILYEIYLLPL